MPHSHPRARPPKVETLPTVTLEHARTGQPLVVDLRDYLAGSGGRFADWRLQGTAGFAAPPPLKSDGGPADPEPVEPELVEPDLVGPDLVGPDLVGPELVEPSPARRRRHRRRGR